MKELSIDVETRSSESIKSGVYKYVESPDFEILLFTYSINGAEPVLIDLTAAKLPEEVLSMLQDAEWLKTAYNAQFERVCINKHFGLNIPVCHWSCTMVLAASLSLPLPLETVSKILGVTEKDSAGKALIRYFCIPVKPKKNKQTLLFEQPKKTFRNKADSPDRWERFKVYNIQDVKSEIAIRQKLKGFLPYNPFEVALYTLDQKINDYGVRIDCELIVNAMRINKQYTDILTREARELTGVANPHSPAQLKAWIKQEIGLEVPSLNKTVVIKTDSPKVKKLLEIRAEISKASIKKYAAMYKAASKTDDRVRGLFQFGGASRTMRWAGRIVQPQNFVKNNIKDLDFVRKIVKLNDLEFLKAYAGDVNGMLSQLLRTSFVPEPGNTFIVDDFSAIEARVLSWYAKESWRIEVFKTHGLIYEASASAMFKVPIEQVTKGSSYRQKGKIAELALGYQGGVGALIQMGADKMGLTETEMAEIVYKWRKANPRIVQFWYDVDRTVKRVLTDKVSRKLGKLTFVYKKKCLLIYLPSGRPLVYLQAELTARGISYMGMHQTLKKWMRLDTYGGKLVENIVQATARDLLAEAVVKIDRAGYKIAMHIHDEIIAEVPRETAKQDLKIIDDIMSESPIWAGDLIIKGDGYLSDYYRKED